MKEQKKEQRLLSVSILFGLLFSFPVISIFNTPELLGGIPLLYLYIFVIWAIMIAFLFLMLNQKNKRS